MPTSPPVFCWPGGARAALSLTFDDARPSQLDHGLPVLNAHGLKATFYVSPHNMPSRLEAWSRAAAQGHELGNHTMNHPCSANFPFARRDGFVLESYTLDRMEAELLESNAWIEQHTGRRPTTFAYPCGQTFVGRGGDTRSYVPLVARHFRAGRRYRDEIHFDPLHGDPAQLSAFEADGKPFTALRAHIEAAREAGGWIVLCAHDVGDQPRQAVRVSVLDRLCRHAKDPANQLWMDTVANVAAYVAERRATMPVP